jgi:ArsR family transcriptional regulator
MAQRKDTLFEGSERELASLAQSLSHPARIAILLKLASVRGCRCADFVNELPLAQATVSQHLAVLVKSELVNLTQQGSMSCYSVNTKKVGRLSKVIQDFLSHMTDGERRKGCCN